MAVSAVAHVQSVYRQDGSVDVVRHTARVPVPLDNPERLAAYDAQNGYARDGAGCAKLTPRQVRRWKHKEHRL